MFGTVARVRIKPENRDRLAEVLSRQTATEVPGYRRAYLMFPEGRDGEVIMVAMFEDRDSYYRNAEDPAQHERYLEYRALMEADPEWTDGEWFESPEGTA